jgi:eukaryotic-like serine/threonine-protein kinase
VFTDPVRAVAMLQVGRALASAGEKTKARAAYEKFLAVWKDADTDIPLLKSARAEYQSLL